MAENEAQPAGPDLALGISAADLRDGGKLVGHVGTRAGAAGALRRGRLRRRRPLHPLQRPARRRARRRRRGALSLASRLLRSAHRRSVARAGLEPARYLARSSSATARSSCGRSALSPGAAPRVKADAPNKIVIVGGGAAGFAAAEMLRRREIRGRNRHAEQRRCAAGRPAEPVEGLSRRQRAGGMAAAARSELLCRQRHRPASRDERRRDRRPGARSLARRRRQGSLRPAASRDRRRARAPSIPGAKPSDVLTLRSLDDCRAIIERAKTARRAVVLGASFIGLEVAASLRARDIEVHVVAPEERPMETILGPRFRRLRPRASRGARRRLPSSDTARGLDGKRATLRAEARSRPTSSSRASACGRASASPSGRPCDRPRRRRRRLSRNERAGNFRRGRHRALARSAHRRVHPRRALGRRRAPGTGGRAQHARATREPFDAVPFFWSQHYDVPINYVGHAESWDEIAIEGDIADKDCLVRIKRAGRTLAVASIFRDPDSLEAEVSLEREAAA